MFKGFLFIGLALGLFTGHPGTGVLLGMGVGFIVQNLMDRRENMWK